MYKILRFWANPQEYQTSVSAIDSHLKVWYVTGFEKRGHFAQNAIFLSLFNLPPFQGSESPSFRLKFDSSLGLLLHRSSVRSLSKPPIASDEPPKGA